jgi:endonuclease I
MKKFLVAIFVLGLGIFLTACTKDSPHDEVFSETLITYQNTDNADSVTSDLELALASTKVEEAVLTWVSDTPAVITIEGNKGKVTRPASSVQVTLTLKVSIDRVTMEKDFKLTVIGISGGDPVDPGETGLELAYHFDFEVNDLGVSYSSNTDADKTVKNLVTGNNFTVKTTRVACNNNHGTYKDRFLVMSASSKKTDNDIAHIEFNFNENITRIVFDATFWSSYDADQTDKLVLQVKSGAEWTDVFDINQALNKAETYKTITIDNLSGSHYRIYGEGTDPTGSGDNGARILFDNFKVYTGTATPVHQDQTAVIQDRNLLQIVDRYPTSGSISLPEFGLNGSKITWSYLNTSDPNIKYLSLDNKTVSVPNEGLVSLTIKATLTKGDFSSTKEFIIYIGVGTYTGYYQSINGLQGSTLKDELKRIISKMKTISYSNTSYILDDSDADPNRKGKVILVYDRSSVSGVWDGGNTWNKEHIWPQSKLGNASKSDLFNLRPSDPDINQSRQNRPYVAGSGSYGAVGAGWFPGEEDKGDIARAVFYMNTRWGLAINGQIGDLQMFIQWHYEDPVDDFERHRNEVIYQNQENRNPYVDHPELVYEVYGAYQNKSVKAEVESTSEPVIFIYLDCYIEKKRMVA